MTISTLTDILNTSKYILGEGAVIERLRRDTRSILDDILANAAFIYDDRQRAALEEIIRQYIDIGRTYDIPLLLSTPTWRASKERIQQAGYGDRDVNGDNFRFLDTLKNGYSVYGKKILICGLMSCRGDAYKPSEALSTTEAYEFHTWQTGMLAQTGIDFILAATLPALSEAKGIAQAIANTGKPSILSFVLRPAGTLLDATPIKRCIEEIDSSVHPAPLAYMVNCTHASTFKAAYFHPANSSAQARSRIIGLLANTSSLSPEALDESTGLLEEPPDTFGKSLAELHTDFGIQIVGGCCGTDDRHITNLAERLTQH